MIHIREEIEAVATGKRDANDNVLKNAPHTAASVMRADWNHSYSREEAVYPLPFGRGQRFGNSVNGVLDRIIGGWQVAGNARVVGPGDAVLIPPGEWHQIQADERGELRFLCCCAPPYADGDTFFE